MIYKSPFYKKKKRFKKKGKDLKGKSLAICTLREQFNNFNEYQERVKENCNKCPHKWPKLCLL